MKFLNKYLLLCSLFCLALMGCDPDNKTSLSQKQTEPISVQVLAINDFHGALLPPKNGTTGGVASIATLLNELQKETPNTIVVGVGDLVGASPLLSSMFNDEPTIEAMNAIGMEASAVGNHEFDKGKLELLRKQNGGCSSTTGCFNDKPFNGAKFKYLAANVIDTETEKTLFPSYYIKNFGDINIAFIGLTLEGTAAIVTPSGTKGLKFENEVIVINKLVKELQDKGIHNIGLLLHEGASQQDSAKDINGCEGLTGKATDIVKQLDPEIDFVLSGHTHKFYNCTIGGIPFVSGQSNGVIVSQILLSIDPNTKNIITAKANNILVDNQKYPADPKLLALIDDYKERADKVSRVVVGQLTESVSKELTEHGDSFLGRIIADAGLYVTSNPTQGSAQIAFTNSGGIRAPLSAGDITYNDVYTVQPFSNRLVTKTLTGQQIKNVLEQQWMRDRPQVMPVSTGFYYEWDDTQPAGKKVIASSMALNGVKIEMDGQYRVAANEFLAEGGSHFSEFSKGTDPIYSVFDNESLMQYFKDKSPIEKPLDLRVKKLH